MKNRQGNEKTASIGKRFLIVLISAVIAVALCVTCALVIDTSKPVDVNNGAGGDVTTSTAHTNKSGNLTGTINNGDTITWSSVTNFSFQLPAGTYTLEVWGAQGASTSGKSGGLGAYVKGTLTITALTQMYAYVGGAGSGTSGGYNGGGSGGTGRNGNSGGGGGGATDFRKGGNALSNRIIVAGGGGGAGGAGQGGGSSIVSGTGGTPGYGGAGAGSAGLAGTASCSTNANGNGGAGGQTNGGGGGGGTNNGSTSSSDRTYYPAGGGGGGGGYYGGGGGGGGSRYGNSSNVRGSSGGSGSSGQGGAGGAGASAARGYYSGAGGGGGGGSSYKGGVTGGSWSGNNHGGSGMARITVVSVNQAPQQKGVYSGTSVYGTASKARMRSGAGITVTPANIAVDPENTTMYFTDGTASNLDTCTTGQTGLWINSSCTTLATNYITWSRTSSAISITAIHRYPKAGVDNAPANGKLRLWTKVRDSYGSNTKRGWSIIYFDLNVSQSDLTIINTSNNTSGIDVTNKGTYVEYSYGSGDNAYHYRLGNSDPQGTTYDYLTNGHIYNTATGRPTVFVPEPLTTNRTAGFTINAADLYRDADTVHDVVGIKSVATDSTNSKYYTISYNADTATYGSSGLYKSITIKPTSVRPPNAVFVTVQITAQSCEKNGSATGNGSKTVIGGTNTSLWLVFKIANTRPYYASSSVINTGIANEPTAIMNVGATKDIKISEFLKDTDGNVPTFVTSAGSVKLPTNEYASVSRENAVLALKSTSNYYANHNKTVTNSWQTGEGSVATGFAGKSRVIAQAGSTAAATACVTYSFPDASTIRFTARAATQYIYNTDNRVGDFYVLVKVLDPGDSGDTGIWYPIAIKVNSSTPSSPATTANFTLGFNTASGEATPQGRAINISPVSYTENGTLYGVGAPASGSATDAGMQAYPFVTDADVFSYNNGLDGKAYASELNEIVMLDTGSNTENNEAGKAARAAAALTLYGTEPFFKVEVIDLWARQEVFANLGNTQLNNLHIVNDGDGTKKFYGLRITPLRSTSNYYFRIDVKVVDSHGTKATVPIEINVENNAVSLRRDTSENGDTRFPFNKTEYGSYVSANSSSTGDAYIAYTIEQGDALYLTPYDFVYDFDMPAGLNENGTFNTNPSNDGYSAAATAITKTYRVKRTPSPTAGGSSLDETEVTLQPLTFANESSIISAASAYSTYFSTDVTRADDAAGVHAIRFTANSRTSSNNIVRFTVTDGFSSVNFAVVIKVSNTAPRLQRNTDILTLSVNEVRHNNEVTPSTRSITLDGYVVDINRDTGMFFVAGSARVVAYDESAVASADSDDESYKYFTSLDYNSTTKKYVGSDNGAYVLSDYIGVDILRIGGVDQIRVTAKSSTQLFNLPLYVEFTVNDDYREQPGIATLRIRVQVLNSDPRLVTDDLAEEKFSPAGTTEELTRYVWDIKYNNAAEKSLTRYLVNCRELYESSAIQGLQSNKLLLFDEADGKQYTLLNTYNTELSGTFVNNLAVRYSAGGTTVTPDAGEYIPAEAFQNAAYQNAAVLYTRTYGNNSLDDDSRRDLTVEVIYYEYTGSGNSRKLTAVTDKNRVTDYWAIAIKDRSNSTTETGEPTQIAIAVKDNHYSPTGASEANRIPVYTASVEDGAVVTETGVCNTSELTVLNFYLRNQAPGLMDMHKQYRTDGNSESQTPVSETNSDKTVKLDNLHEYQFVGNKPSSQDELASATFTDDFKYQYYVNVKESTGDDNAATLVSKAYPGAEGNAFYYKAVEVPESGTVNMPISYIAMPNGYSSASGTTGTSSVHVTFANAGGASAALKDAEYLSWKDDSNARALIMQNLTLTDGTNTWSGTTINNNPYIQISYVSNDNMLEGKYVNHYRGTLSTDNQFSPDEAWKDGDSSKFREDKFGFSFTKRSDSEAKRPSGALKFTVSLKTYRDGGTSNSAPQDISVDIEVENSVMANIKYNTSSFSTYATIDIKTHVGAADTTVGLSRTGGQNTIQYTDADTNDTARFFMPSASAVRLGNVLSSSEISAMMSNALYDGSYSAFFESKGVILSAEQVADFVPNKDYTNYFTVTPSNGSSSSVTFKPLAKTQLNISGTVSDTDLWNNYHLKKDANGDMYYPFKVVFYDDINSSNSFARGKYMTVVFRVYIDNSPISSSLKDKEGDYFKTDLTLVKGAANTIDVSTILTDSDIPLNAAKSMIVKSEWDNLSEKDKLTKDYLVMPVKTGGLPDYSRYGSSSQTALPIDITYAENSNTTIKFEAKSAFTTPSTGIPLLFKFRDSVGTEVGILFYINYVNEAPTVNEDTYGGARTLNIFMKTGDSFTIYASDASKYATDVRGEFKSPAEFDRLIASTGSDKITYPQADGAYVDAETMRDSFELLTRDNYDSRVIELNRPNGIIGDLGSLVLGDDDAPSTLRFVSTRISGGVTVGSFSGTGIFDVAPGNFMKTEDALKNNGSLTQPMSVKITAGGVGTSVYTATLTDGSNTVDVVLNLTVLSTPPAIKTTGLPAGLVLSDDEDFDYEITLDYGAHKEFALRSFVTDKDRNDERTFDIADSYDGEKFKVINPEGVSAVAVSRTQIENGATNAFYIEATDYIPEAGKYSEVYFRVTDAHDSQSEEIRIKVNIAPRDLEVKSGTQPNAYAITLDSYAEYLASGRALTVDLVGGTSGSRIYYDPDVDAPSALYDVEVYAMYSFSEGTRTTASTEDVLSSEDYLVISRTQARRGVTDSSAVTTLGSNSAAKYIRHFFEITLSDDGKTMTLVPVSSTVSGGTSRLPEALNLYIVVGKAYKTENGYTMSAVGGSAVGSDNTVGAYVNVAVGNSAPVAVQSTALNFGYPYAGEGEDAAARDYDFLFFAGSAGDSLTWNLYDTENEQRGLFYDYDMRNYIQAGKGENADANLPSTNETLTYAGNSILPSYTYTDSNGDNVSISTVRDAIDGGSHGPVLSITEANGKVTIKINRKVAITQPSEDNRISPYSDVPVEISCIDTLGRRQDNQTQYRRRTVIIVRVENDPPEFKKEVTRNDYRITYSDEAGYELSASVATGKTLTVRFADILDDADVDMDAYFLYAPDSSCIKDSTTTLGAGTVPLFDVALKNSRNTFGIITLSSLEFTCTSIARGEVATGALMLYDSTRLDNAHTSKLTIRLTVGNTAPKAISSDPVVISVMGIPIPAASDSEGDTEEVSGVALTENIIKYMTDINPNDAVNAAEYNAGKEVTDPTRSNTYMYVKDIEVYTIDADMTDLRPDMFGPGTVLKEPEEGEDPPAPITKVCDVGWADSDMDTHQSFSIMLTPGVYGTQHVRLYVRDDGYLDGAMNMISDGIDTPLDITIIVSRPIDDMNIGTFSIANRVTRTMTADILLNSEEQPDNARGYSIKSISAPDGGALTVASEAGVQSSAYGVSASANETEWRITANYETEAGEMTVLFDAGGIEVEQKFNVTVTRNNAPVMKHIDSMGIFTEGQLNDQHMIVIRPDRWFDDPDVGDVMRFNDAKVKVGAYAAAHIENGNIVLIFKGRGTTQLTFNITDATGNLYSHSIEIGCTDMAELSTWNKIVATIQSNVLMYSLIGAGVLLLIILLIIILVVVHKRRKMRREIEALLDSESELEEEMLRLSAGAPQYQSFGYLPPTSQTMNNPNLMIGSAADNPTPNSLQLGAGTGQTAGVSPDSGATQQLASQQSRPGMPQQGQQPRQPNGQPMPQQSRPGMPQQGQPRQTNGQPMPQQSRPGMPQNAANPFRQSQPGNPQQQPRQNTGAPQGGQPQNRDGFNPNDF